MSKEIHITDVSNTVYLVTSPYDKTKLINLMDLLPL